MGVGFGYRDVISRHYKKVINVSYLPLNDLFVVSLTKFIPSILLVSVEYELMPFFNSLDFRSSELSWRKVQMGADKGEFFHMQWFYPAQVH